MNIKDHIEAGHYPCDDKGRALVPMRDEGTFTVAASDKPKTSYGEDNGNKPRPIVGWDQRGYVDTHCADSHGLLPPRPRKVKVTRWHGLDRCENTVTYWGEKPSPDYVAKCPTVVRVVELTGEYEEPSDAV